MTDSHSTTMEKVTHTPGPWHLEFVSGFSGGKPHAGVWIRGADDFTSIAHLIPHDGVEGNAYLIAAAPELLTAAKAALNDRMYKDWPGIADLLIAAIGKAEGSAL